jgi:hypothetical protein
MVRLSVVVLLIAFPMKFVQQNSPVCARRKQGFVFSIINQLFLLNRQ